MTRSIGQVRGKKAADKNGFEQPHCCRSKEVFSDTKLSHTAIPFNVDKACFSEDFQNIYIPVNSIF